MSEYWVSKKRYWCKYCDIYIADDAPSRQHHEGGLRHKGNVERFIRNLYKTGEKRKKDAEEEKREMARIGKAAEAAYAQDVAGGLVKGSSSSAPGPSASSAAARKPTKPSNPYADYTTAAQLGYEDPDEARLQAELERRRTQGGVGTWEVVESHSNSPAPGTGAEGTAGGDGAGAGEDGEGAASAGTKREAPQEEEEDERSFKIRKKTTRSGLGEIYDPGMIPVKLKPKKEPPAVIPEPSATAIAASTSTTGPVVKTEVKAEDASTPAPDGDGAPKVAKIQWKRAAFTQAAVEPQKYVPLTPEPAPEPPSDGIKKEEEDAKEGVLDGAAVAVKIEDTATGVRDGGVKKEEEATPAPALDEPAPTKNMFRKRKVPAGGAGRRGA